MKDDLLRRLLSKPLPLPPLQAGVEVNTSIGILTYQVILYNFTNCHHGKLYYTYDWLTGVFTQSELGLLNKGELSPSPQFSLLLPRLTSSRSALISSVDRARIIGEQGSDLAHVCEVPGYP